MCVSSILTAGSLTGAKITQRFHFGRLFGSAPSVCFDSTRVPPPPSTPHRGTLGGSAAATSCHMVPSFEVPENVPKQAEKGSETGPRGGNVSCVTPTRRPNLSSVNDRCFFSFLLLLLLCSWNYLLFFVSQASEDGFREGFRTELGHR